MQSKSTQESWLCQSFNGDLLFGYDQMHKTHQPRTMYDPNNGTLDLYWDANGNLAQMIGCKQNSGRLHEWDEENRLRFVLGEKFAGYYGYDANGERVYKLTGISNLGQVNSGSIKAQAIFDDAVKDGVMYEIKDAKAVYDTKQIQGEYNAAKEAGYEFKIVTGEKTHVSKEVQSRAEIIRRSDLGPQ